MACKPIGVYQCCKHIEYCDLRSIKTYYLLNVTASKSTTRHIYHVARGWLFQVCALDKAVEKLVIIQNETLNQETKTAQIEYPILEG
jgi:hypothetical protein